MRSAIAWLTRAVPTASNGFIAAMSRKPGAAGMRPEPGHVDLALGERADEHVEGLLRDAVELLDVEQPALAQRRDQRAVDEDLRQVAGLEHERGVEVADQPRRRQLRVALDELDAEVGGVGDGAQQRRLPVPGGPSRTTWMPVASAATRTSASRRRPTMRSSTRASRVEASGLVTVPTADRWHDARSSLPVTGGRMHTGGTSAPAGGRRRGGRGPPESVVGAVTGANARG